MAWCRLQGALRDRCAHTVHIAGIIGGRTGARAPARAMRAQLGRAARRMRARAAFLGLAPGTGPLPDDMYYILFSEWRAAHCMILYRSNRDDRRAYRIARARAIRPRAPARACNLTGTRAVSPPPHAPAYAYKYHSSSPAAAPLGVQKVCAAHVPPPPCLPVAAPRASLPRLRVRGCIPTATRIETSRHGRRPASESLQTLPSD